MQYRMLNIAVSVVIFASLHADPAHADEARCAEPLATLASVEGLVETAWQDGDAWRPVSTATRFCPGDRLRVGANSRAAVVLSNHTVMRLDALSTLNFTGPQEQGSLWVELLRGISHFISRVPRRLTVSTPYVNAGVEGTEFLVTADDRESSITVFEGRVNASNPQGSLLLTSGQSATATSGSAPVLRLMIKPRDGLHWALHYPSITQFSAADFERKGEADWLTQVAQSFTALGQSDRAGALAAVEQLGDGITDARFFTYRASLSLGVGRADAAERDIGQALKLDGANGDALALQAVIALAQNDKERGLHLAMQAVDKAPHAAGAHLALSYAWQAQFELDLARAAAQEAVKITPHDALAWARLAELHLMFGERDTAIAAAEEAERLDPRLARSQSVLGFAYLNDIRLGDARQAFEQAAMLDPGDPLPRLGLGLIQVREGKLESGRQQMELAASLDPDDALVRSYLGKAYYEEKRDARAASQFDTAKALDPNDPTPWFYDAILEQSNNRPVDALQDLQTSIALNDNRAVYRSRLLLDEDAAARSASIAGIHRALGFEHVARMESVRSLGLDVGNFSAHRLLADTYVDLPGHEIARASELLQAQLLQPINLTPVNPGAAQTNLLSFEGTGPSTLSFNEFNPLFYRKRPTFQANAVYGSDETRGSEAVVSALMERGVFSLGRYTYQTEGVRQNNDKEQTINNVFFQYLIGRDLSAQIEYRDHWAELGDTQLLFDGTFSDTKRRTIRQENWRLGLRYGPGYAHTFLLAINNGRLLDQTTFEVFLTNKDVIKGGQYEAQYLGQGAKTSVISGVGYLNTDRVFSEEIFDPFADPPIQFETNVPKDLEQINSYVYTHLPLMRSVLLIGVSYDSLIQENGLNRDQLNPKLGLTWEPSTLVTLRMAALRTLRRQLVQNQTLEPTHIAGFNQFFDDELGTKAWRYGVGLDYHSNAALKMGVEFTKRALTRVFPEARTFVEEDGNEWLHRAYLYRTFGPRLVFSAEHSYEKAERSFISGEQSTRPASLTTQSTPLTVQFFEPSGFFARLRTTYVNQQITNVLAGGTQSFRDDFVILDAALGYRFHRRGIVELSGRNLGDTKFRYQSTDPWTDTDLPSPYYPYSAFFVNAQLWF